MIVDCRTTTVHKFRIRLRFKEQSLLIKIKKFMNSADFLHADCEAAIFG